jgi:hypothetical protein
MDGERKIGRHCSCIVVLWTLRSKRRGWNKRRPKKK